MEWHKVVTFGRLAEVCGEYLRKGKQVYVEGRISSRSYVNQEGNKAWVTEIIADRCYFLGSRNDHPPENTSERKPSVHLEEVPF